MTRLTIILALTAFSLLSFIPSDEIPECYLSLKTVGTLKAQDPDPLSGPNRKPRTIPTSTGDVDISVVNGFRVLYINDKDAPFVNLKVELSAPGSYAADKSNLIAYLQYINNNSESEVETTGKLIEIEKNGYKIWGSSRKGIDKGQILGNFIMFPAENIVVYFYFNNLRAWERNFDSWESYVKQRDEFFEVYTSHLKECFEQQREREQQRKREQELELEQE